MVQLKFGVMFLDGIWFFHFTEFSSDLNFNDYVITVVFTLQAPG